jgi:hypothetical protein
MNAWVFAFAGAMLAAGWGVVRWLTELGAREYRQEAEKLGQINSLPDPAAATRATILLQDASIFRQLQVSDADNEFVQALAPELRGFLQRYGRIEVLRGPEASVCRSWTGPSVHKEGFLRIGVCRGDGEIAVRPDEEAIYELYSNDEIDATFGTYKSVYHWALAMAMEAKEGK